METNNEVKKRMVKVKYDEIARQSSFDTRCDCSCGCNPTEMNDQELKDFMALSVSYKNMDGYNPDADLGLGCGLPTEFAQIKRGDTVVDLGSGAGNDCFIARAVTGEEGRVIGIDMTEKMVEKARINAQKLGYNNVEFLYGDIEKMPINDATADVVVSNCVLNLVPEKNKAFSEVYRILKKGGHFSISDIVLYGDLPKGLQKEAEMYVGCISGAIQEKDYLDIISKIGFNNITIQAKKEINLSDALLYNYLSIEEIKKFRASDTGIYSITVFADK